jgi:hypothetical protein
MAELLTLGAFARMLEPWSSTPATDRQQKQTYPLTGRGYLGYAGLGDGLHCVSPTAGETH